MSINIILYRSYFYLNSMGHWDGIHALEYTFCVIYDRWPWAHPLSCAQATDGPRNGPRAIQICRWDDWKRPWNNVIFLAYILMARWDHSLIKNHYNHNSIHNRNYRFSKLFLVLIFIMPPLRLCASICVHLLCPRRLQFQTMNIRYFLNILD